MTKGVIGREYEQSLIRNYYDSDKAELVAIYGRRRVGKTFLVKKMFGGEFAFSFTGMYNTSRTKQLGEFRKALERYSGKTCKSPKDWFEAFQMLRDYLDSLTQKKIIVFLDELPWMDTPKGNFIGAFGEFWNDWGSAKDNLKLYVWEAQPRGWYQNLSVTRVHYMAEYVVRFILHLLICMKPSCFFVR